jgi:DnaJ-class molecular chaperone
MRSLLREPKPPYDDEAEEDTPAVPPPRRQRCRVCRGTGRIHVIQGGKEVGRPRRCPACRGAGSVPVEQS